MAVFGLGVLCTADQFFLGKGNWKESTRITGLLRCTAGGEKGHFSAGAGFRLTLFPSSQRFGIILTGGGQQFYSGSGRGSKTQQTLGGRDSSTTALKR